MAIPASFGPAEKQRLRDLIFDGVKTLEELESLKVSMKDTIDSIAEELQIPSQLLKKAITIAHKGNFKDHENELKELEAILDAAGKK